MDQRRWIIPLVVGLAILGLLVVIPSMQQQAWMDGYLTGTLAAGKVDGGSANPMLPYAYGGMPYMYGRGGFGGPHFGGFGILGFILVAFLFFGVLRFVVFGRMMHGPWGRGRWDGPRHHHGHGWPPDAGGRDGPPRREGGEGGGVA